MTKPRQKTNIRKMSDTGGGVNPEWLSRMRSTGQLKEYASLDEMREARAAREKRGVKETTPAYLLPDDHYRKRKRANITMSAEARAVAKKIGGGVLSRGIERALMHWQDCPRTDRRRTKTGVRI